jgi:flagellar biosynthesis/type III secretory pathway M-ring protein FliF/YscJ
MAVLERARRFWSALSASQKILLGLVGGLLVLSLAWGSGAAAGEPMDRVLGAEADDASRAQVLDKLRQSGQPHEVRGREVWVPRGSAHRVLMDLAGDGVLSPQAIWKNLQESDPWASRAVLEKRSQIALQQYLEMMIRKIDAVRGASVVISPGQESGSFFRNGPRASASVSVQLHPGREFTSKNSQAIAGLVAGAVPGLERERVQLVVDGKPRRVGAPDSAAEKADSHREYERSIELDIEKRISEHLPMLGSVMIRIKAKASDSKSSELSRGRPQVVREKERRTTPAAPAPAAQPRIKGDAPDAVPAPPAPVQDREVEVDSVIGSEKRVETVDPAGAIEKITVSALYPYTVDKEGKELGPAGPSLDDLRAAIVKAAGPPCASEDVTVTRVPTRAPEPAPAEPALEGVVAWVSAHWTKAVLLAFAVLGLALLVRVVRGATAGGDVEEVRALATELGQAVEAAVRPAAGEGGAERERLREAARENPEALAASLRSWMESR